MTLDVNTLHFASAAGRCAYVIVFLVMVLAQRRQIYLWYWMGAMGASMAGSLILMQIPVDTDPPVQVAMVSNWMYAGSLVLSWTGLRVFFGRPVNASLCVGLVVLPGLAYPAVLALGFSNRVAISAIMGCCLVVSVLSAWETIRRTPGFDRLWSQFIEFVAFAFYSLVFVLSIAMLLGTDRPIASPESARASLILDQITGVFVHFGYAAMAAERANRTLARLADTDLLTGLYNRRGLQKILCDLLPPERRLPHGGILLADIDHFKSINDAHGHDGGDAVLAEFAARLKASLRATDIVARWGGEEFLVVLPGATQPELLAIAERLRVGVAEKAFILRDDAVSVTISIGAAAFGADRFDFEDVTSRADAALYEAKARGRNRACWGAPAAPSAGSQEPGVASHPVGLSVA